MKPPPVQAIALFFDDIRSETGNKLSLMGQLLGTALLARTDPPQPLDRLAILIHARWPLSFRPKDIMLRVAICDRVVLEQAADVPAATEKPATRTEFSGLIMQAAIQLRGQPIAPGDDIKVWFRVDGIDIPAGRLKFEQQPTE